MITVALQGGLGNQMWQRAYGLALESRGYLVQYDKSRERPGTHREYALGIFGEIPFGIPSETIFHEGDFRFEERKLNPPDPCTAIGYWQSPKFFEGAREKILTAFQFKGLRTRYVHTIALHVRRQDYLDLQQFHGTLDINYYREAVARIRRQAAFHCPVVVFSDDPTWCQNNLPSDFQIQSDGDKYEDLKQMSSCDYHVIANSSYSWWAAWLSQQRLVVAPKQWFSDPRMQEQSMDICPDHWTRI